MFERCTADPGPEDEPIESHRCRIAPGRCLGTELDNRGEKHSGPVGAEGRLCEPCTLFVTKLITRLDDDWYALSVLVVQRQHEQADKVSYTPDPGVPLNVDAESKQVELLELIDIAADMVCANTDTDYTPPTNRTEHFTAGVKLVATNVDVLLAAPADWALRWDRSGEAHGEKPTEYRKTGPGTYVGLDRDGNELDGKGHRYVQLSGIDVAIRIWDMHGLILGQLGVRKRDLSKHYPMPCHSCGARQLFREFGEDLIRCRACPPNSVGGRGWNVEDYDRLAANTKFHLKVIEEEEMRQLDEATQRAETAEAKAADLQAKLDRVAKFAGHETVDELLAILDKANA